MKCKMQRKSADIDGNKKPSHQLTS